MTDSKELRRLINEKGLKLGFVAQELDLSSYGLQKKIDNQNEFKISEVSKLCELLDIVDADERMRIFFA